jgi:hypothetical protein
MWRLLWRFIVVSFGFLLAGCAGLLALTFLGGREISGQIASDTDTDPILSLIADILGMLQFAINLGPALTLVPALALIIIGEVGRIRSAIYYLLSGGAAFIAMPLLYVTGDGITGSVNPRYLTIFAAAGFIAGFIYWAAAGRKA